LWNEIIKSFDLTFREKEDLLAQKLRNCCDSKGTEISSQFQESASIFNELGLIYKLESPDKISLIQSAALFNAALLSNQQIRSIRRIWKICVAMFYTAS